MQNMYVIPVIPTKDSNRKERGASQKHLGNVESLRFELAQTTKGSAVLGVQRYERNLHPNGREALLGLERTYGTTEHDER